MIREPLVVINSYSGHPKLRKSKMFAYGILDALNIDLEVDFDIEKDTLYITHPGAVSMAAWSKLTNQLLSGLISLFDSNPITFMRDESLRCNYIKVFVL